MSIDGITLLSILSILCRSLVESYPRILYGAKSSMYVKSWIWKDFGRLPFLLSINDRLVDSYKESVIILTIAP
jgi:hypothetical protein